MPDVDIGPIFLQSDLEDGVAQTMSLWVPWYLARIDEADGRDPTDPDQRTLPPRVGVISDGDDTWLEETPPFLSIRNGGTIEQPDQHGAERSYGATWQMNLVCITGGATEKGSRRLAYRHAAAIRLAVAQIRDMGGIAEATWWRGERVDVIPRNRKLMGAEILAHVRVHRVVDERTVLPGIPPTDPTLPPVALPTPTGVRVTAQPTGGHFP